MTSQLKNSVNKSLFFLGKWKGQGKLHRGAQQVITKEEAEYSLVNDSPVKSIKIERTGESEDEVPRFTPESAFWQIYDTVTPLEDGRVMLKAMDGSLDERSFQPGSFHSSENKVVIAGEARSQEGGSRTSGTQK